MRQRILITGASSGLGAEMARQFAGLGRDLVLCARRLDRLEQLREQILAAHPDRTVMVRNLDVDDHDDVFTVFRDVADQLGGLDRVIVNAGLGKGAPVGTGRFDANKQTITTNLVSALAQCEAAMEIFRKAGNGHLVVASSVSAMRGMPKSMTAYAASKAGLATLAEGIRAEMLGSGIAVTTVFPGYIRSEMNERVAQRTPLMTGTVEGVRAMVAAIEHERAEAIVPPWPWRPLALLLRHAPLRLVRKFA
ncbi:MAG TPA: SDR family oxidoreductase [Jatrophihabitans sp.]|nr:SDR family oxidoreductase [Jatrophihabitans sp.]